MSNGVQPATDNKRLHLRFDKAFPVLVSSDLFGSYFGIARNISEGGMLVETVQPLPLGTMVTIHFAMPDCRGEIAVLAEIKHQYFLNYQTNDEHSALQAMGLRFTEFLSESADLGEKLTKPRVLH